MFLRMPSCISTNAGGCKVSTWIFRNAYKAKMPKHIRNGLAGKEFPFSNTKYLARADKLYDTGKAAKAASTVASVDDIEEGDVSTINTAGRGPYREKNTDLNQSQRVRMENASTTTNLEDKRTSAESHQCAP